MRFFTLLPPKIRKFAVSSTRKPAKVTPKTYAIMKKLIMLLALLVSFLASAQVTPEMITPIEKGVVISNVEKVADATPQAIHDAIIKWVATTYKNPKYVIKGDTPTIITLQGDGPYLKDPTIDIRYTVTLTFEIKEGRYKWTISDAKIIRPDLSSIELPLRVSKNQTIEDIALKFSSYVESFQNSIKESCSEDW